MEENWKDIKNYPNYQVSDIGNVRSLNYKRQNKTQNLKPSLTGKGYLAVTISNDFKQRSFTIHVLVAQAFLGHTPDKTHKVVVDHKDNNKTNNNVKNLQLIGNRENTCKDRVRPLPLGVSMMHGTYRVQLTVNSKMHHLGVFRDPKLAGEKYQQELRSLQQNGFITNKMGIKIFQHAK